MLARWGAWGERGLRAAVREPTPKAETGLGDGVACAPETGGCTLDVATDGPTDGALAEGSTDASAGGGPLPPPDLPA